MDFFHYGTLPALYIHTEKVLVTRTLITGSDNRKCYPESRGSYGRLIHCYHPRVRRVVTTGG